MPNAILKYLLMALIMLAGCFTDFQSKRWAKSNLAGKPPVVLLKGFVDLGYTENRGMVFGLLNDGRQSVFKNALTWVRVAIFIGVSLLIGFWRKKPFFILLPFLLIWAGAIGNLVDAFANGFVVDFIHIHAGKILDWPFYFNLADAYLCVGMGILLITSFFSTGKRKTS
ncbi:MAG: signal peptidase II [Chitinispirillaceae bacterium]|nr:signal peptidase II [Chitinispirillaceae bacterium]